MPATPDPELADLQVPEHYLKSELYGLIRTDSAIFEFLQSSSLDGIWFWDVTRPDEEWLSPRFKELFGYTDAEVPNTSAWWQENIHPDDLSVALENFEKHLADPDHPYDQLVRYAHKDGSTVWVRCRGLAIRDEAGRAIRMLGAHTDVTELMETRQRLEQSEKTWREAFEKAPNGVAHVASDGRFRQVNAALVRLLGRSREELLGSSLFSLAHPEDLPLLSKHVADVLADSAETPTLELRSLDSEGRPFWVAQTSSLVRDSGDGEPYLVIHFENVDERRRVDRLKNEFVSNVSHELRTPLAALKGSLGLIVGGVVGSVSDEAGQMLSMARANTDRLIRVVNDILDIEKMDSGVDDLQREAVEPVALAREVIAELKELAREAGITLRVQTAPTFTGSAISGDRDRLAQVLTNLIGNAIKFSPSGQAVVVQIASPASGGVEFSIVDHGPGIPVAMRDSIFDRFCQVDSTDTRKSGGSGLGLAIAKAIVENHGGQIGVKPTPGHGSTFHFWIPS